MPSLRCASLTLAVLCSTLGQAVASEEVMALDYRAPSACPSSAEFEAQIRGFVPALSIVPREAAARVFEISIDDSGRFGSLRLSDEHGVGSRLAQGADCAEVARLLAFAIALVLDPQLQIAEPPSSTTAEVRDPGRQNAEILPPPLPVFLAAPPPAVKERATRSSARRDRGPLEHSLAAAGIVATAMSPAPSYGAAALYGMATSFGKIEPQLRLGASFATSSKAFAEGATVKLVDVLGVLEGCPARWQVVGIALRPCLRVDAGARSASASGIPAAKSRVRPWLSLDALLEARVALASRFFLELGGGVMLPVLRDRLFFEPDFTIHEVPLAGFLGQIALGVEFPDRNRD